MFLRGYGSQSHTKNNGSTVGNTATNHASGNIGVIQGDALRVMHGGINPLLDTINGITGTALAIDVGTGIFRSSSNTPNTVGVALGNCYKATTAHFGITIHNGRITATANENRPVNIAVRYLIRTRS